MQSGLRVIADMHRVRRPINSSATKATEQLAIAGAVGAAEEGLGVEVGG